MQQFLIWLEGAGVGIWLRESLSVWAFPMVLTLHTVSMAFLAGLSAAIDLRILGVAVRVPLSEMKRFLPVLWLSFLVSLVTGVALVISYPAKALTNPVFYVKLILIALSLLTLRLICTRVLSDSRWDQGPVPRNVKALAAISLASWALVIIAGRMLPYTYGRLFALEGGAS